MLGRPAAELFERALSVLTGVAVYPFDSVAGERYGQVRAHLEAGGRRLPDPDLRIAAIALVRNLVLISGNLRHFTRIPGLRVEDWIAG